VIEGTDRTGTGLCAYGARLNSTLSYEIYDRRSSRPCGDAENCCPVAFCAQIEGHPSE
jgi:hypothetical protein